MSEITFSELNLLPEIQRAIDEMGFETPTDIQAQAIVEMTLGRLSGLERRKIEERLAELYAMIAEYKAILADEGRIKQIIKEEQEKRKR